MVVIWERLDPASFVADTTVNGIGFRLVAEQTPDQTVWEWLSWPSGFPDLASGGEAPNVVSAMHAAEFAANQGGSTGSLLPAIIARA